MEQIKDVSIIQPLLSGQVLVFNGEIRQNLVPQNLVNDTTGSLLDINISPFKMHNIYHIYQLYKNG